MKNAMTNSSANTPMPSFMAQSGAGASATCGLASAASTTPSVGITNKRLAQRQSTNGPRPPAIRGADHFGAQDGDVDGPCQARPLSVDSVAGQRRIDLARSCLSAPASVDDHVEQEKNDRGAEQERCVRVHQNEKWYAEGAD